MNKINNTVKNSGNDIREIPDDSIVYLSDIDRIEMDEQLRKLDEEKKIKYDESKKRDRQHNVLNSKRILFK